MTVMLIGLGCGAGGTMTVEAREAIAQADCLIGAERLLASVSENSGRKCFAAIKAQEILTILQESGAQHPCVVYSGDTGFYSGTRSLIPLLEEAGMPYRVLPGISSVQMLSAQLGRPWQDWTLYSAHGTHCDAVAAVSHGKAAFFLTGGTLTPAQLCRQLTDAGLGDLQVTVAEDLSYPTQRILCGRAAELAEQNFAPLSVMLAEAAPMPMEKRCAGLDDSLFVRGEVPMTKQEVRAAVLGKLAVQPSDVVWDVGAGTGSVSVELAMAADHGRAYAIECERDACDLIRINREKFGAWNLTLIEGKAPDALDGLPAPDAVFIGGTKGGMEQIVSLILEKNPAARICISAIALETLSGAVAALTAHGLDAEVTQIAVSRTKTAGKLHLLMANNPIFLICARRREAGE